VRRGLHATLPWRQVVEAILWLARTGAQWRELSERYGSWSAVWLQWRRWRDKGVWDVGVRRLNADVRVSGGVMRSRAWSSSTQRPPGATLCLGVPREGWGGQLTLVTDLHPQVAGTGAGCCRQLAYSGASATAGERVRDTPASTASSTA